MVTVWFPLESVKKVEEAATFKSNFVFVTFASGTEGKVMVAEFGS